MAFLNLTSLLNIRPVKFAPQGTVPGVQETEHEKSRQIAYWRERLSGSLPITEWPGYRRRPVPQPYTQGCYTFEVQPGLKQKAEAYASSREMHISLLLLAAFRSLLFRYCKQEDLIVGMQAMGVGQRTSNILPLRLHTQGSQTFRQFLSQLLQIAAEAYSNSEVSYEELVTAINAQKNIWQFSVFQVIFKWKNFSEIVQQPEAVYSKIEEAVLSSLDIRLECTDLAGKLICTFHYDSSMFNAVAVARMAGHLQILLEAAIANDEQSIDRLPMLTPWEQKKLLTDFNHPEPDFPLPCAHHLFEQQVRQSPDAVALVYEGQQLTYTELNSKANQLAHFLQKLGVGPEKVVGLCLKRSPEFIVGLLAILKAGGAFMPVDPDLPADRLTFILEDASPVLLLTREGLIELPDLVKQIPHLFIDQDWPLICRESSANPEQKMSTSTLMYVIYTSGSSGKPKGVLVEHTSLSSFLKAYSHIIDIQAHDRVLQFVPVVFDPMVEDVFCAFYHGASLVLRTETMIESVEIFLEKCKEWKVSILNLPASYWHIIASELTDSSDMQLPDDIRLIKVGGERLLPEKVHAWKSRFGNFPRLMNAYGPTETTIAATMYDCANFESQDSEVPIGSPLANTQAFVLDAHLQPVPVGLIGELYIGGQAITRGYLNRDELTVQKFVPNPFSTRPGAKLYRTGDLVRWLPDGKLDYQGRGDDQIKLRGFRIELGEIESVLGQHPMVKQAVVVLREEASGEKRLIAYVVTGFQVLEVTVLRGYLKEKLPPYMIPSHFILLDRIPLTFNGKIDRNSLPSPSNSVQLLDKQQAPQTHEEQLLATMWMKLLSIEEVGIYDNFFEIGGQSLLAARLTAEIRNAFNYKLPLSWVFAHPTIKVQAEYLVAPQDPHVWDTFINIQPGKAKDPLYLVHDGSGGVEYGFQVAQFMDKDRPIYGFQAVGMDGTREPLQSVEAMADCYLQHLLSHQPEGPYHIGAYSGGAAIAYEMIYRLTALGKQIGVVAIFDGFPVNLNRFTYQRIGLIYVLRSIAIFLFAPGIRFPHKLKLILKEIPEIIHTNWMRIVIRLTEQKAHEVTNPDTKFHLTLRSAVDSYQIKPYSGPIIFVRAIDNQAKYLRNSHFGWGKFAATVEVHDLPGDHKSLFRSKENARVMADIIDKHLAAWTAQE
jgi:amino acid adenylation domain-containing protein